MWLENKKDIKAWLTVQQVENFTVNEDLTVSVAGSVNLSNRRLTVIPFRFRSIEGHLDIGFNMLSSLEFCPPKISGALKANHNHLTNLLFCPEVGQHLYVHNNLLETLEGCPKNIPSNFFCHNNNLKSLKFAPKTVKQNFNCSRNEITSLEFGPEKVFNYYCSNNPINTLEFIPSHVGGEFLYTPVELEKPLELKYSELLTLHKEEMIEKERQALKENVEKNSLPDQENIAVVSKNNSSREKIRKI